MITYLKTDAAEAEILTGLSDRYAAARLLHEWGAKEVMITHNTEVILYDGESMYSAPLKPRNLTGRTGRGDTTFAGYLAKRLHCGIEESLQYAAALVSLKMETPGPFTGTDQDVYIYMNEYYSKT
jgi:sugar/nucleoside kinase (ribokinase family)